MSRLRLEMSDKQKCLVFDPPPLVSTATNNTKMMLNMHFFPPLSVHLGYCISCIQIMFFSQYFINAVSDPWHPDEPRFTDVPPDCSCFSHISSTLSIGRTNWPVSCLGNTQLTVYEPITAIIYAFPQVHLHGGNPIAHASLPSMA